MENTVFCDVCNKKLDQMQNEDFFVESKEGSYIFCVEHYKAYEAAQENTSDIAITDKNCESIESAFIKGKGWAAQSFFNEFINLKNSMLQLQNEISLNEGSIEELSAKKEKLAEQANRFRYVVEQLNLRFVSTEELLLLSIGVEPQ